MPVLPYGKLHFKKKRRKMHTLSKRVFPCGHLKKAHRAKHPQLRCLASRRGSPEQPYAVRQRCLLSPRVSLPTVKTDAAGGDALTGWHHGVSIFWILKIFTSMDLLSIMFVCQELFMLAPYQNCHTPA